ncbi:hypothetical protein BDV28DRAFT_144889 [Aspergillus coremiiformis]|uniref:Uncharacterized protein n=1 Tax=Aspergillus coremiiformis TaxID=138285 RepID=A0A5N6ZIJ5_9EURO|nr:hypothetical protein BDV28DRAFT_144889 [Aspergillus coremiiformis]
MTTTDLLYPWRPPWIVLGFGNRDPPSPGPGSNERLTSLTGLPYFLYSWLGSYYNGTTTFNLQPLVDNRGGTVCPALQNRTISFKSESILAVTATSNDDGGHNPVRVALRSALTDFDFVYSSVKGEETKSLRWEFQSLQYIFHNPLLQPAGYRYAIYRPYFNLSLTNDSPPYHITGSSNYIGYGAKDITMKMRSCQDAAETSWNFHFLNSTPSNPANIPITDPTVNMIFDSQSASFSYNGWFSLSDHTSIFYGKASIEFQGKIDPLHSDILNTGLSEAGRRVGKGTTVNGSGSGCSGFDGVLDAVLAWF